MTPTLRVLSDGMVRSRRDLRPLVATMSGLTEEQMKQTLASGQPTFENRIGWALSYLNNVGALTRPSRGNYQITDAGRYLLAKFPVRVFERDVNALGEDPASPIRPYVATVSRSTALPPSPGGSSDETSALTPIEQVQNGVKRIHDKVSSELLERLQGKEPAFFEQAVVNLLVAMGYGGANGSGSVTQLTNDGGIDGVIDQDILGLSRVYIQAKRYATGNSVGRPDVQGFVGALHGRADSGVFITTSHFSQGARDYVASSPTRIVLIDGQGLTDLMIQFKVGVQASETYTVVEIDEDFFA
ncbi:restriction endonuclease [Aestuariimicrobium sp. T2.26MG-19.2B]|uniref:restriction endonuclease n=1 Tax=Aestuariimicrobium sp. T2.26MG-19.2B TaxID=3040679 RepID=UPI002541A2D9|nr:restriction endonuclease [Aestuariimicrobium sp. T2.26MG-19.2B]